MEEKNLFDEIWESVKLEKEAEQAKIQPAPAPIVEEPAVEEPVIEEPVIEEPVVEEPIVEEPIVEEPVVEEPAIEEPVIEEPEAAPAVAPLEKEEKPAPKKEKPAKKKKEKKAKKKKKEPAEVHTEKKKDVKFLVIYTVVFLLVISGLIAGSWMISNRIQKEMAAADDASGTHQSALSNIRDKNKQLSEQNAALKETNDELIANKEDADALIDGAGDMVEHNEYLAAAMNAYIDGERALAREILSTVDRDKLSPTHQEYYDTLKQKLN